MKVSRRNALKALAALAGTGVLEKGLTSAQADTVLGVFGSSGPKPASESGVGALMAWANRLWAVTYLSEPNDGSGTGLYSIDKGLKIRQLHVSNGVYANRLLHPSTNQINIGPYMIDAKGNVRIIQSLVNERLTATMLHLSNPNLFYILTMEGRFHEVDARNLETSLLYDLTKVLAIKGDPHFKGGATGQGKVVVANNTYQHPGDNNGRLAQWDGSQWQILEDRPFMEVASRGGLGNAIFATGWDEMSALLKVCIKGQWSTYRLPKASHTYDYYFQTEWTRIRPVETERDLMDCHGMFYELSPVPSHDAIWGLRPICTHLRVVPDFCSFDGYFVMAGNEATRTTGNLLSPQSQSGIWFGQTDDLWKFGKPKGWGGVWRKSDVKANSPSDPFLMTGFDKKVLHLWMEGTPEAAVTLEVDFLGYGDWHPYQTIQLRNGEYHPFVFPDGFDAHWARVTANRNCRATAQFFYS